MYELSRTEDSNVCFQFYYYDISLTCDESDSQIVQTVLHSPSVSYYEL